MPYTISHAIIALPVSIISKRKVPVAAVMVGAASPDFPYLIALSPTHAPGHSSLGVFVYCLIPSLIVLFFWYRWLELPTLEFWKLPTRKDADVMPSLSLIVVGVLIGAYSHMLWDATSHSYGFIAENSDFWQQPYFSLPLYKWNQYGSGVFGLVALSLWYVFTWLNNSKSKYTGNFYLGAVIYGVFISALVLLVYMTRDSSSLYELIVRLSIAVMSGGIIGSFVYGVLAILQRKHKYFDQN